MHLKLLIGPYQVFFAVAVAVAVQSRAVEASRLFVADQTSASSLARPEHLSRAHSSRQLRVLGQT